MFKWIQLIYHMTLMANIFSYESLIPKKFVQKGTQTEEGQYIITVNNLFILYKRREWGGRH